jgi:hypothetical protein
MTSNVCRVLTLHTHTYIYILYKMAFNLAYYDFMGKLPAPYESVLTKAFKHGRVTVARNMSEVIAENTKAFSSMDKDAKVFHHPPCK